MSNDYKSASETTDKQMEVLVAFPVSYTVTENHVIKDAPHHNYITGQDYLKFRQQLDVSGTDSLISRVTELSSNDTGVNINSTCIECGKQFRSAREFESHMKKHTDASPNISAGTIVKKNTVQKIGQDSDNIRKRQCGLKKVKPSHQNENTTDCIKVKIESKKDTVQKSKCRSKNVNSCKTHMCSICKRSYSRLHTFLLHKKTHSNEESISCEKCNMKFFTHYHLKRHQRSHLNERICNKCGKKFMSSEKLDIHMSIHEKGRYQCDYCGKLCKSAGFLRFHQRSHTGLTLTCDLCDKKYMRKTDLERHKREHTQEIAAFCSICGQGFTTEGALSRHTKGHNESNNFLCRGSCGKFFKMDGTRRFHEGREHSLFYCLKCSKRFESRLDLKNHRLNTHRSDLDEDMTTCMYCNKTFSSVGNRQRHEKQHNEEKKFECSHCTKRFYQKRTMQDHEKTHTGEKPFHCCFCGKGFIQNNNLKVHEMLHQKRNDITDIVPLICMLD